MSQKRVLFVLTNHDRLGAAGDEKADKTGFHLAEAARPWRVLTDAGIGVDIVTPKGGKAPVDPSSHDLDDADNNAFVTNSRVKAALADTQPLDAVDAGSYDAVYFPGGHGTMWDLPESEAVQAAVRSAYENGKVVAAVCHGPAALVNVKLSNGDWLVAGKTLSVFTDDEERAVEKEAIVPFLLASKLEERGATIDKADNFEKAVSVSDRIVTGQNPASAEGVGEAIRDAITARDAEAA